MRAPHRAQSVGTWPAVAVLGTVVLALLTVAVSAHPAPWRVDATVARWLAGTVTPAGHDVLVTVTRLGQSTVVDVLAVVLALAERLRTGRWRGAVIVGAVVAGDAALHAALAALVGRPRPPFLAVASTLGGSFPSGHTTAAAGFLAIAAWTLGQRRAPRVRRALGAAAVTLAVAVAVTRVLLELHWTTDVIGGLALGWTWSAVCVAVAGE